MWLFWRSNCKTNIKHTISGVCNTIHGFFMTFEGLNECPIVCIVNLRRISANVTKIFRIEINFKSEDVDYQNTVSSGNDELTSIGFECKVVNAAMWKYSRSELAQNKRTMYAYVVILTTAQLCPCRGLYRPMLVTLSFSTKKNIKFFISAKNHGMKKRMLLLAEYHGIPSCL